MIQHPWAIEDLSLKIDGHDPTIWKCVKNDSKKLDIIYECAPIFQTNYLGKHLLRYVVTATEMRQSNLLSSKGKAINKSAFCNVL